MSQSLPDDKKHTIGEADRVPLNQKLAYGIGGFVAPFIDFSQGWMLMFYTQAFGLNAGVVATAQAVFRAWDFINDPLIGSVSDNSRSRFGRRRPFIVVGGVLFGFSMPLLWAMNPAWPETAKIIYMVIAGLILYTTASIWSLPYQSLAIEMTADTNERTRVLGVKTYFCFFTGLVNNWIPKLAVLSFFAGPTLADGTDNLARGLLNLTIALGVLIGLLAVLPGIFCKEKFFEKGLTAHQKKVPLLESMLQAFSCLPFLSLLAVMVTQVAGALLVGNMLFFVSRFYVCNGDYGLAATIFGVAGTISVVVGLLSVPFWVWISERFGKRFAVAFVIAVGIATKVLTYVFFDPESPWLMLIPQTFMSFSGAALWMIIPSMLGDVIDLDELEHGTRREGVFNAVFLFCVKISITVATLMQGWILVYVGYDESAAEQTLAVSTAMRDWYVYLPIAIWTVSMLLVRFYSITEKSALRIRAQLEERRGVI